MRRRRSRRRRRRSRSRRWRTGKENEEEAQEEKSKIRKQPKEPLHGSFSFLTWIDFSHNFLPVSVVRISTRDVPERSQSAFKKIVMLTHQFSSVD
ncbi:unnamed protein product [Nesidiocoris tenuis]|uniref:Uncharacterized protein n=1 Tax=Nesidiocoris tenuis TaxID=355587 RepID=A0A6H5HMN5_9HEMI|nr:unnamed protein product [Nesidiocoris tenuis]